MRAIYSGLTGAAQNRAPRGLFWLRLSRARCRLPRHRLMRRRQALLWNHATQSSTRMTLSTVPK
jgi:hypothetical protein